MLLGTLGASLLENVLAGKGVIPTSHGRGINIAGEGIVKPGYGHRFLNSSKNKKVQKTTKWIFNAASFFN